MEYVIATSVSSEKRPNLGLTRSDTRRRDTSRISDAATWGFDLGRNELRHVDLVGAFHGLRQVVLTLEPEPEIRFIAKRL
jgi:hypothetical protein